MKLIKTEETSPTARRLTIEIEQKEVEKALERSYKGLAKTARLKGFRPGKAPRSVLERYYGDQVAQEVAGQLIQGSVQAAIDESGLTPCAQPQAEPGILEPGKAYEYFLDIEVKPEVEIDDYFGLELEKPLQEVTEEVVTERLEELRQVHAKLDDAPEGAVAADGDYVTVDMVAEKDGEPLPKGKLEDFDILLGRYNFHADVEKAIIGLKAGESTTIHIEFAKAFFHDGLAGQEVDLAIELKKFKTPVKPELDDEFAKSISPELETVDDLTKMMRERLEASAEQEADRKLQEAVLSQLSEKTIFEAPQGMVVQEGRRMIAQVENQLAQQGMNFDAAGIDIAKLEADIEPQALRRVKEDLILEAIALKEGLEIDDEALEAGFRELADQTGQNLEEIKKFHEEQNMTEAYRSGLLRRKTMETLIEKADVTIVDFDPQAEAESSDEKTEDEA